MKSWLYDLRKKSQYSQEQLANEVGVSRQMINLIENGKRRPSPKVAKKIAEILNFEWTKFFE